MKSLQRFVFHPQRIDLLRKIKCVKSVFVQDFSITAFLIP